MAASASRWFDDVHFWTIGRTERGPSGGPGAWAWSPWVWKSREAAIGAGCRLSPLISSSEQWRSKVPTQRTSYLRRPPERGREIHGCPRSAKDPVATPGYNRHSFNQSLMACWKGGTKRKQFVSDRNRGGRQSQPVNLLEPEQ